MRFYSADRLNQGMVLGVNPVEYEDIPPAGTCLTEENVKDIRRSGYPGLYVEEDFAADVVFHNAVSKENYIMAFMAVATESGETMLEIAMKVADEVTEAPVPALDMMGFASLKDDEKVHAVRVGLISALVAAELKLSKDEIAAACMAGFCHDLGHKLLPPELVQKATVNDEEFKRLRMHPEYSLSMMANRVELSEQVKEAVRHHHENENGSGYPDGLDGSRVGMVTKIVHAVDEYDRLMRKRADREPRTSSEALDYIWGGSGILFAPEVVEALFKVVPEWYPGTEVTLSNGERALVLESFGSSKKPVVKVLETGEILDLEKKENEGISVTSSDYLKKPGTGSGESGEKRRHTIMLVDDMLLTLMQTQKVLGDEYDYVLCHTGLEAINYVKENPLPDLMIVDIDMPVLDGIATVRNFRKKGYTDVPVIFLTGTCNRSTVLKCKTVGAADYILKPAKPVYLQIRVQEALKHIS